MKRIVIESPYAGDVEANIEYAKKCVHDSLARGEAPYASHLFFTQPGILDDLKPEERKLGIEAGFAWGDAADVVVFYVDRGWSRGMREGYKKAITRGSKIELRSLDREIALQEYADAYDAVKE